MDVIKSSNEISLIFEKGKRIFTKDLTLIVIRNAKQHGPSGRAAFIAGKRLGNAVWRNRAKRRMRSLYRELSFLFEDYDVLFVAKRTVNVTDYAVMAQRIKQAMGKESV